VTPEGRVSSTRCGADSDWYPELAVSAAVGADGTWTASADATAAIAAPLASRRRRATITASTLDRARRGAATGQRALTVTRQGVRAATVQNSATSASPIVSTNPAIKPWCRQDTRSGCSRARSPKGQLANDTIAAPE